MRRRVSAPGRRGRVSNSRSASRPAPALPARFDRAAVASSHHLASEAGLAILRRGGSAADASIAMGAVLCVVYPHMTGLGGDGFWLVWDPVTRQVHGLNGSGPAAALASRAYYRERGCTDGIPERGALSALTVPGTVDGWRMLHERWGRLAWSELFDDARALARTGAPVGRSLGHWIAADEPLFASHVALGTLVRHDPLVIPGLDAALARLAEGGARAGFYEGKTAAELCRSMAPLGSPLRADDFAAFRAEWVEPLGSTYRDVTAWQLPPNSQGWTALNALAIVDGYNVRAMGDGTADYYHHLVEALKLALADRDAWLADPRYVDAPLGEFLSEEYARARRALIDPRRARAPEEVRPGIPFSTQPTARPRSRGDTCYHCAVDADGLAVSAIESLYYDFGSAVLGGSTGILLQNRGASFSLDAGVANTLAPGKRPAHTLMPAMLMRDDAPFLVFGTMGGDGQPQTQLAVATRIVDFGFDVQQAIAAPRWRYGRTWGESHASLALERRIPHQVRRALERRGHEVLVVPAWSESMGHAHAIRVDRARGCLEVAADPRSDGAAAGY